MGTTSRPPKWIKPQLTRLVDEAPAGGGWLHEIKYDGYRMHARIDGGDVKLLTRTGLDWSHRYRRTIEALGSLKVKSAYLDGELCALNGDGGASVQPPPGGDGRRPHGSASEHRGRRTSKGRNVLDERDRRGMLMAAEVWERLAAIEERSASPFASQHSAAQHSN